MSFVVWAALAIAGLVALPVIAHLLRRGRANEREFPGAALVPAMPSTARERSRLSDQPLFALRAALILGLAVLGAMPLVRCDRLSLARTSGASVALAIVLDDSLSMRSAAPGSARRFDAAVTGARQLLASAREGDSVTLVLAGRPARVALSSTTDLDAARRALSELAPSDRSTDLAAAVQLARAAVRAAPQKDHKVVLLSDLAADAIPDGTPEVDAPLESLRVPASDCGIATAEKRGAHVTASVACNAESAARERNLEVVVEKVEASLPVVPDAGGRPTAAGDVLGSVEISPREGEQSIVVEVHGAARALGVRLTGTDANERDDLAAVSDESSAPSVAVVADSVTAGAKTGGPTVVEQALAALAAPWIVRPLELVPDDERAYQGIGALVVDDPRGLSPDARTALERFLQHGGVALALVGPRGAQTDLGTTLEPFLHGALRWEPVEHLGIDPASVSWLGAEASSLEALARRGRARLDGTELASAQVIGRWSDSVPFLVERAVGRGLAVTAGLPASLDESDLAVRPGFLALLDHLLRQADERKGSRRTVAGTPWTFAEAKHVAVTSEGRAVPVTAAEREGACADHSQKCDETVLRAVPTLRGRYVVHVDDETEIRTVTVESSEILAPPRAPRRAAHVETAQSGAYISASREIALVLLALVVAELALRLVRRWVARAKPQSVA